MESMGRLRHQCGLRRGDDGTSIRLSATGRRVILPASRRHRSMSLCLLIILMTLIYVVCAVGVARADVDMTGRLEKVSSLKTTPGEAQPLATSVNGDYRCADEYSVIGNKPYYFAIGNCKAGWTLEAVAYASENTETHEHSYGGYIGSAYSYCGWIDTRFPLEKFNSNKNSACTNGSNNATELEDSSFMEKYDTNNSSHDGNYVVNPLPCPEYANYRPWSTSNVEKELIRTAPAYVAVAPGSRTPALKWRYTTKYSSTDGTGQYVMVRDARITGGGEGNWVFVPRSCLSSPLPANEGESTNPPPPTATTGGYSSVTTTSAVLTGSVNPNGLETHYYIEWGREASKPYEALAPAPYPGEDIGSGTKEVGESVPATGLKSGTVYYYRIVAQSPTGTSEGGLASFTTVAEPPEATTTGASEIAPLKAQLNGSVNPKGTPTTYYFKYGKTISYGSKTEPEGNAGSGQGFVGASATVTLEPGTTYHYRIVAHNAGGTFEGGDQELKTPGPVEAVTSAATGITEEQATLNGTVNPRGYDAKYYFQYGTTISYGSRTEPEGEAGAGTSAVPASASITGLETGGTYHFRLVAISGGITSYGSDQTVRTLMPKASVVEWDGTRHVYYRGLNNQLHERYWNGSEWSQHNWGYAEVAGNPSAVVHSNGSITVYYRNTNGQLAQWWFGPNFLSEWSQTNWGYEHEVASDPSAVVLPNGSSDVYYRATSGQLGQWWYGTNWSSEWSQRNWGYEHEVAGVPSAVAHSNDTVSVYYRSTSGQLGQWWYGTNWSSEWSQRNWGYEHEVASDPSAVVLPNGSSDVYYRDTKAQIGQWWYGTNWSSEWSQRNWGYENEVAGTPSAVAHSNNNVYVYYRAATGQLGQWWYGTNWSSEWSQQDWGYLSALGGEPSASALAAGGDAIYYGGTTAQMWEWYIDGSSWKLTDVGAW
jgi:hypothetical protein